MSALLHPDYNPSVPAARDRSIRTGPTAKRRATAPTKRRRRRSRSASVHVFPIPTQSRPLALTLLSVLHKGSNVFTLGAITAMLGAYALTLAPPRQWNQQYQKLSKLERDERYLRTNTAAMKEQLARQALRSDSGLVVPSPEHSPLFLTPTPVATTSQKPTQNPPIADPSATSRHPEFSLPAPGPLAY